jgi:dephospho-CoA kinase
VRYILFVAMIVGLTGGIGAGKSAVARMFQERGAVIVDTDAIAREVVQSPSPVLDGIRAEFGDAVIDASGGLDRDAMARIVFADETKRRRLNELTHPEILKRVLALIGRYPPATMVVVVVPLLFESGFDRNCQKVVSVVAPEDVRLRRVIERDGAAEADVRARMRAQLPDGDYERRADLVIRNEGGEADLRKQADAVWDALARTSE